MSHFDNWYALCSFSSYLTENCLRSADQSITAILGNNPCSNYTKHSNSTEKTQGVLKLKKMVHIVTTDYCELWRVANTETVITKMVAPVFLCLLGVSRYSPCVSWQLYLQRKSTLPLANPRTVRRFGPRGGRHPALSDVTREITFLARTRTPTL
jgi:hypothetical protein